jgi:DNA-binding beta-propeller fold protein YncE
MRERQTLEFQKLTHRRLIGAVVAAAAMAAAGLAGSAAASADAGTTPDLQTLTYTSTGLGGGLYHPVGVSAAGGTVYVSNSGANIIATISGGTTTAFAGSLSAYGEHGDGGQASAASLYHPGGSAVDGNGDVFIADSGDNVIREVTPAGTIKRFAGTGIAGLGYAGPFGFPADLSSLDHPQNVAVNAAGDVYVADTYNNRILKVTPSGQVTAVAGDGTAGYSGDGRLATFAELNQPAGVAVDAKGNLYIADSANNVIRRVDATTGVITTVAGDYAADQANGGLGGFSGDGGPATSARLNVPQGVAIDGAGDLFIADTFNNAIREVSPAGTITTVVNASAQPGGESNGAAATASKLNTPYGVAIDPSTSDLYIADTNNSKIAEVTGLAQSGTGSPGTGAGPVAPARS